MILVPFVPFIALHILDWFEILKVKIELCQNKLKTKIWAENLHSLKIKNKYIF